MRQRYQPIDGRTLPLIVATKTVVIAYHRLTFGLFVFDVREEIIVSRNGVDIFALSQIPNFGRIVLGSGGHVEPVGREVDA